MLTVNEIKELKELGFSNDEIIALNKVDKSKKSGRKAKNIKPTEKKRKGQQATRSLEMHEVELMFSKFEEDAHRLMFKIMLNMSLRVSDVIDLTVGQLLGRDVATVYIKKQKTWMKIAINDSLKEALELYLDHSLTENDYIFQSREAKAKPGKEKTKMPYVHRTTAWRWMTKAAAKAGIVLGDDETIACHGIRKFFGTEANNQGHTIAEIQVAYGHSNPQTTIRYLGIDAKKVASMRNSIQA